MIPILQRYGLSVFLRKAYPALRATQDSELGTRNSPCVRGGETRTMPWADVPADIRELVRRRASADPIVAAHITQSSGVELLRARGAAPMVLDDSALPVFIDIPPGQDTVIFESLGSDTAYYSTSAGVELSGAGEKSSEALLRSGIVMLRVGSGARVRWFSTSVGAPGFSFIERIAVLALDAVLEHHSVLVAANAVRENIHVMLNAPGATARVRTLFAGAATHQFDLGVTAEHRAPRTTSDLRAKGVLAGKAQGVYRGLVRVEKDATGSDGYQRCDALLLSPTAEVDPIPNLEIETNDVRCTHGVTVSRPDPEQVFYLQSRGLGEDAARDLLVEGFVGSMLQAYPMADREQLKNAVNGTLADGADLAVLRNTVK